MSAAQLSPDESWQGVAKVARSSGGMRFPIFVALDKLPNFSEALFYST